MRFYTAAVAVLAAAASVSAVAVERRFGGSSSSSTTTTPSTTTTRTTTSTTTTTSTRTTTTTSTRTTTTTSPSGTPTQKPGKLQYFGGPVIPNVEVSLLLWGSNVDYASALPAFYDGITASPWIDVLSQYYTPTQTIGRGKFTGQVIDLTKQPGFPSKTSLDDTKDIQPFLLTLIKSGVITPNNNSYYAIHFASGYSITLNNAGSPAQSCQVFGAYHSTASTAGTQAAIPYFYYGVMPNCGYSQNSQFSVASHELAEAISDPYAGIAATNTQANQPPAYPIAWNDPSGEEVADLCSSSGTTIGRDGKSYSVQTIYSNNAGKCVTA